MGSLLGVAENASGHRLFGSPFPGPLALFVFFFVDVLRFSVGITKWNSTELLEVTGRGREREQG